MPSPRRLAIAILLLGGAVVNIAVAWMLMAAPNASFTQTELTVRIATHEEAQRITARLQPPDDWPIINTWYHLSQRGCSLTAAAASPNGVIVWSGRRIDVGWPARSMMFVRLETRDPALRSLPGAWREERLSLSLERPSALLPGPAWFETPRDRIPLTPVLPGFLLNTLFYAAVLRVPLMFFPLRRWRRRRRGRCVECNYDLTGIDAPCPECGKECGR
jgi:hypothetical protein